MHRIRRSNYGRQRSPLYVHHGAGQALRDTLVNLVQGAGGCLQSGDLWALCAAAAVDSTAGSSRKRRRSGAQQEEEGTAGGAAPPPADADAEPPLPPPVAITMLFYPEPNQQLLRCPAPCVPLTAAVTASTRLGYSHPMAKFPCDPGHTIGGLYSAAAWYLC
jgi:hypothetical protein